MSIREATHEEYMMAKTMGISPSSIVEYREKNKIKEDAPRDYINELDEAIQVFHSYPEGYEKKYYATVVCSAAIRLRESQK